MPLSGRPCSGRSRRSSVASATTLPARPWAFGLAVAFGFTGATNAIEGSTAILALATAAVFIVFGWYHRREAGAALLCAYAVSLALIAGWGLYWQGFPQFSELGWV